MHYPKPMNQYLVADHYKIDMYHKRLQYWNKYTIMWI